jgi:hypothetical protein
MKGTMNMKYAQLAKELTNRHVEVDPCGSCIVYVEVDFKNDEILQVVNCTTNPIFLRSNEKTTGSYYCSGSTLFNHWNKQKELENVYKVWLKVEKNNRKSDGTPYEKPVINEKIDEENE